MGVRSRRAARCTLPPRRHPCSVRLAIRVIRCTAPLRRAPCSNRLGRKQRRQERSLAGADLDHSAGCTPARPQPPRPDVAVDPPHRSVPPDPDQVDREPHPDRVDRADAEPQPVTRRQPRSSEQAPSALRPREGPLDPPSVPRGHGRPLRADGRPVAPSHRPSVAAPAGPDHRCGELDPIRDAYDASRP